MVLDQNQVYLGGGRNATLTNRTSEILGANELVHGLKTAYFIGLH
jgi:hypothetical protein